MPRSDKKFRVFWGNPNEMQQKDYSDASRAKEWGRKQLAKFDEFAAKFNHDLHNEIQLMSKEIDELPLLNLPVGDRRGWEVRDEPTGIRLVVRLERIE